MEKLKECDNLDAKDLMEYLLNMPERALKVNEAQQILGKYGFSFVVETQMLSEYFADSNMPFLDGYEDFKCVSTSDLIRQIGRHCGVEPQDTQKNGDIGRVFDVIAKRVVKNRGVQRG